MGLCWDQYWSNLVLVQRTKAASFIAQTCSLKPVRFTADLLASVRLRLWHSLNLPSGGSRRQPCHAGHCLHCTLAVADASRWSVWATLWPSLEQRSSWQKLPPPAFKHAGLKTCHAVVTTCYTGSLPWLLKTCPSKQAGLTVGFLWLIWATLWLSLERRSSWPRLQTSYSGHMLLPLLARQYVPTKHARPTKPGWPFTLVGLSNALTLAWATL